MPAMSSCSNAARTSARANGFTIAVTSIIARVPLSGAGGPPRGRRGGPRDRSLNGVRSALSGADPDDALDRGDPDLPVTDLAGAGGLDDRVDHLVGESVVGDDLHADLRHEVHGVLSTPVDLRVALLAAVALHLADRHAQHAELLQRPLHVLEDERLDDGRDELHG